MIDSPQPASEIQGSPSNTCDAPAERHASSGRAGTTPGEATTPSAIPMICPVCHWYGYTTQPCPVCNSVSKSLADRENHRHTKRERERCAKIVDEALGEGNWISKRIRSGE